MAEDRRYAMARNMYEGMFDGVKTRTVEIKLLEETYQQALELAESNGWPPEEALLTIFAHGLAQLRAAAATDGPDGDSLRAELMRLEGMYSVMKFRAFTLTEENQRMRMALTAYRQEHPALVRLVEQLRGELEDAKRSQTQALGTPRADERLAAPGAASPKPATRVVQALLRWRSRRRAS